MAVYPAKTAALRRAERHVDNLGAMVKEITSNGRLRISRLRRHSRGM